MSQNHNDFGILLLDLIFIIAGVVIIVLGLMGGTGILHSLGEAIKGIFK